MLSSGPVCQWFTGSHNLNEMDHIREEGQQAMNHEDSSFMYDHSLGTTVTYSDKN